MAAADGMTNLLIVVSAQNEADGLGASVEAAAQTIASEAALTAFDAMSGATVDDVADAVFAGGYEIEIDMGGTFDVTAAEAAISDALAADGYSVTQLSVTATDPDEDGVDSGLCVLVTLDGPVAQLRAALEAELGETYPNLQFLGAETVGAAASIGLPAGSVAAVIVVLVLALVYLAVRGGAMAGVTALIALVHDLLVMLALTVIFSFFGPTGTAIVPAALMVAAYSILNSAALLRRIREAGKDARLTAQEIATQAMSELFNRNVAVHAAVLIALICLCAIATAGVRGFALPMLAGVLASLYSSTQLTGAIWAALSGKRAGKA